MSITFKIFVAIGAAGILFLLLAPLLLNPISLFLFFYMIG